MKTLLRHFTILCLLAAPAHAAPGDVDPLDATVVGNYVFATAVQPDGKTILAGSFSSVLGVPRSHIARLNADGTLDAGFDPKANTNIYSVAVQADGKVLLGGWFTTLQPNGAGAATARQFIARVNADGTLDTGFDPKANGRVYSVAVHVDGKVLLGGTFSTLQPNGAGEATARNLLARLVNDPATQTLTAPDATQALWQRGGAAPELSRVTFELSTDGGANWTPLGPATRIGTTAYWQLTGLSLPASGQLRARGATTGGYFNGSSGMVESVASFSGLLTPLEMWRQTHFGTTADTGNAANDFDFDRDGIVNLLEFAFGLDPTEPSAGQIPVPVISAGTATYTFARPAGVSGITSRAEWSTTLLPGSWTPIPDTGIAPQHVFSVSTAGHGRIFTRLAVTAP